MSMTSTTTKSEAKKSAALDKVMNDAQDELLAIDTVQRWQKGGQKLDDVSITASSVISCYQYRVRLHDALDKVMQLDSSIADKKEAVCILLYRIAGATP